MILNQRHQQYSQEEEDDEQESDLENVPPSPIDPRMHLRDEAYSSSSGSSDENDVHTTSFGGVLAGRLDARVAQHGSWGEEPQTEESDALPVPLPSVPAPASAIVPSTRNNNKTTKRTKLKKRGRRAGKSKRMDGNPLHRQTTRELVEEKRMRLDARTERMKQDVGKRLSIYSSKYDEWAKGEIVAIDAERRMHCVQYDDEERRWHRMDLLKFSMIDQ